MLNNQLSKVYYEEALQEAARSRAERGFKAGRTKNFFPGMLFTLALVSVAVWLAQMFAG